MNQNYIIAAGILIGGVAIGLFIPLPNGENPPGETIQQPIVEEVQTQQTPLSSNVPVEDTLSELEEPAEVPEAETEPVPEPETTIEELEKTAWAKIGTVEGIQAATDLLRRYTERGNTSGARTMRLLAANSGRASIAKATYESFSGLVTPGKTHPKALTYTVKPGDTLTKIGQTYKIPANFIQKINGIDGDRIFVGQNLKVVQGPFWALVVKGEYRLTAFLGDEAFREFQIGLGKNDSTPVGEFKVLGKLEKPTYWVEGAHYDFGDPNNPLGTRWITFRDGGYGIHGTWEPNSIGKQMSHGCVRMLNEDVEELYDLLVKYESKVIIRP
ncbi:MAG: L,D-transpeptidase family protein [Planctomycetota bacterium]|nr:L,D-transpeptidase family protein [Planctomycetota bacterium]MDA1137839.1 L,D-transpeptidase family protein [Planctomycetota bacterium]